MARASSFGHPGLPCRPGEPDYPLRLLDGARKLAMGLTTADRKNYTVIRNCIPKARVIRITAAKVGLPSCDKAL